MYSLSATYVLRNGIDPETFQNSTLHFPARPRRGLSQRNVLQRFHCEWDLTFGAFHRQPTTATWLAGTLSGRTRVRLLLRLRARERVGASRFQRGGRTMARPLAL